MSKPLSSALQDVTAFDIKEPSSNALTADDKAKAEDSFFSKSREDVEIDGLSQDIAERKKYAGRTFCLICFWLSGVFFLLLLQGFGKYLNFGLEKSVLLAVIGSTTVNVLGIFITVMYYLFDTGRKTKTTLTKVGPRKRPAKSLPVSK